jgi:hypothetical protein
VKVCIAGVGRSATTTLYVLVRHMMLASGLPLKSYYEPFLWGERTWHREYADLGPSFATIESFSVEGMAAHKRLPMFVADASKLRDDAFLTQLLRPGDDVHVLAKFIRASGRLPLLQTICPEARFIFVIRDPLSVVNSLASSFSAFGEGYHPSDYGRFLKEVREKFDDGAAQIARFERFGIVGAQALYWYFNNRHAIDFIRAQPSPRPFRVVTAASITAHSTQLCRGLVEDFGLPWLDRLPDIAARRAGRVTESICLEPALIDAMAPLLDYYAAVAAEFVPHDRFEREALIAKFKGAELQPPSISFENFTANRLRQTGLKVQDEFARASAALAEEREERERMAERLAERTSQFEQRSRNLEGELAKTRQQLAGVQAESQQQKERFDRRQAQIEQRTRAVEAALAQERQESARVAKQAAQASAEIAGVRDERERLAERNAAQAAELEQVRAEAREITRPKWLLWLLRRVLPADSLLLKSAVQEKDAPLEKGYKSSLP